MGAGIRSPLAALEPQFHEDIDDALRLADVDVAPAAEKDAGANGVAAPPARAVSGASA
jgi:hypothetical protein